MNPVRTKTIQPEQSLRFKGFRESDTNVLLSSSNDTLNSHLGNAQSVIEPDYVQGETAIVPYLVGRIRKAIEIMSSNNKEHKDIRSGLDYVI